LVKSNGTLKAQSLLRVSDSDMRAACKDLIGAAGLDPARYATHSSKRGGALLAMRSELSTAQIKELGRWSSSEKVARYTAGDKGTQDALAEATRV
jgi:hypothetical protein